MLPSPNGSTICAILAEAGADVVVAGLRNRRAVAAHLLERGGRVLVVPAGERWPDGSLRPAIEDLWGAGGVVAAVLETDRSVEASEEAVLNSLVANEEMIGFRGHRSPALPRDRVVELLRDRGRVR